MRDWSRIWKQIYLSPLWDDIKVQSRQAFNKHLLKEWLNIPLKQCASISIELCLFSLVMFSPLCGYSISLKIYYHIFTYMTVTYTDYKKIIKSSKGCLEMWLSFSSFIWWFILGLWGALERISLSACWLNSFLLLSAISGARSRKQAWLALLGSHFSFHWQKTSTDLGHLGK